jgi:hypothetical protein
MEVCSVQIYYTQKYLFIYLFIRRVGQIPKNVVSVRPSFRSQQLGSHWKDFDEILHWNFFLKYFKKIQDSLKFSNNNG